MSRLLDRTAEFALVVMGVQFLLLMGGLICWQTGYEPLPALSQGAAWMAGETPATEPTAEDLAAELAELRQQAARVEAELTARREETHKLR